ncbi:11943_t:CDS:2 [Funneliformis geosporum]|nr:11943_t:CDS:2 [Funneliformis geosporum]
MGRLSLGKETELEEGYPSHFIASREDVNQSSVIQIKQKANKTGSVKDLPKTGRPRIFDDQSKTRSELGLDKLTVLLDQIFSTYQIISSSLTHPFAFTLTNIPLGNISRDIFFNLKIITGGNFDSFAIQPKTTVNVFLSYPVVLILIVLEPSAFEDLSNYCYNPEDKLSLNSMTFTVSIQKDSYQIDFGEVDKKEIKLKHTLTVKAIDQEKISQDSY